MPCHTLGIGRNRLLISIRICNLKIQYITDHVVKHSPEVAGQDLDVDQSVGYDVPAQVNAGWDLESAGQDLDADQSVG